MSSLTFESENAFNTNTKLIRSHKIPQKNIKKQKATQRNEEGNKQKNKTEEQKYPIMKALENIFSGSTRNHRRGPVWKWKLSSKMWTISFNSPLRALYICVLFCRFYEQRAELRTFSKNKSKCWIPLEFTHHTKETRNPNPHYKYNSIVIIYSILSSLSHPTGQRHSMHPIRRVWASPKD